MSPGGYSGKPLIEKLGYKPGDLIYSIDLPKDISDYFIVSGLTLVDTMPATWLHGCFMSKQTAEEFAKNTTFDTIEKGLWLSWPKRASNVPTDLTEQTFRDILLPMGWVDTKVAAIDQTWSGLKFLRRKT